MALLSRIDGWVFTPHYSHHPLPPLPYPLAPPGTRHYDAHFLSPFLLDRNDLNPRQARPSLPSRTPPCTAPLPAQAVGDKLVANAAVGRLSFKAYASLCKSFHPFQNDFIWVFNIRSIVCVSFFIIFFLQFRNLW